MHSCDSGCTSKRCMKIRFAAALNDDDRRRDFSHVDFLSNFSKPKMPTTADVARRYANHVESVETSEKVGIKAKVLDFSFPIFDDDDASSSDDSDQSSASSDADDADATTSPAESTTNTESEPFTGKETQRTKALQYFLQEVLDPNLEEMATISRSRPFCGMPGCGEPCDLQCLDCIGYYCEKHHIDLNQTHSTRVWNDELFYAKKAVLLPGFQDTSFVAKINSTPSFWGATSEKDRPA